MQKLSAKDLGMTPQQFEKALKQQSTAANKATHDRIAKLTPDQKAAAVTRRALAKAKKPSPPAAMPANPASKQTT